MMTKTACLNCDDDKTKVNGSEKSSNSNNSNNIFNKLNEESNTMLAQNGELDNDNLDRGSLIRENTNLNTNTNTNTNNKEQAPCPPCGRCPDTSNFECKKVPNYEMGLDNPVLPRPVLSNFSTFGM